MQIRESPPTRRKRGDVINYKRMSYDSRVINLNKNGRWGRDDDGCNGTATPDMRP